MKTRKETIETLILDAAMDVFSGGGFQEATMRSIAEKAKVPTSSIYKYFRNKDDLYATLVSIIVDRTTTELNMHLTGLSGARTRLREMARFHLDYFQENENVAQLVCASTNMSYWYENEKVYQKVKESGSALARIIKDGQRKGEIREDVNLHVANHMYFGAMRAMVTSWLSRRHRYRLSAMSDDLADAVYGGLCANTPGDNEFVCPLMKERAGKKSSYKVRR